jgi:hypothetical protein
MAVKTVKAVQERETYYPGTEELASNEMRVTACGTGMPNARPKQAAVEESVWPQPSTIPLVPPDPKIRRTALSKMLLEGRAVHTDVLQEIYDDMNKRFGIYEKVPE